MARRCVESVGAQRVSLPTLTSVDLWETTGRLGSKTELLSLEDRHGKPYILSPTHEEAVADLLADVGPISYKQLPLLIYQISSKFRDEQRPKHGVLRAREFRMLDAYGAHAGARCASETYRRARRAYRDLFRQLALDVHAVEAPAGEIGGSLSHEWQLPAAAGEDRLAVCQSCRHASLELTSCPKCGGETDTHNSIEVGHTFVLGTRYSAPLRALVAPPAGPPLPLHMSCYGLGITRLLAASLEVMSTERCLRWPRDIAPYSVLVIGPKEGSREWSNFGPDAISAFCKRVSAVGGGALAGDVVVDDRGRLTVGRRVVMADKMGYPYIIVCGRSTLDNPPKFEVYRCAANQEAEPTLLTVEELLRELAANYSNTIKNVIENKYEE
ncbi:probable proline--tRNA ligase, mitochondrial isoform X2 [Plodia interpunctella]|nr:probable proline--tRNA ligase, mitochondrial isoform X2 [Plodia interpunctella]